ncbi:MAG: PilZ domain-containing protein [Candidatus Acidiferrales bacterium]
MNENSQFERRRLNGRVHMRVPVEVRCNAADGSPLEEKTHTGVVGLHGAMVRMSRQVEKGAEVEITNHFSQQTAKFRVVWVNDTPDSGFWEIGIESLQPLGDFWGVRFPPRLDAP